MCVFCKIITNEITSYKVYEDAKTLAFLDNHPTVPGHTLVLPKTHYPNLEAISEPDLSDLILTVKKIGRLLKDKLGIAGYNIIVNNDPVAGQIVPHLHFHIIPRASGDGLEIWTGHDYKPGEAEALINKLTSL
ncbi:MAG: HIT family protein [Candidatus Falkowbacteria bacterium]|nr:HIT family protein [Candidatus Falkowbacteria bacterium]